MVPLVTLFVGLLVPGQIVPEGSRSVVFQQIYGVFLVLGTLVGIVVTVYMVWKAWKYRAGAEHGDDEGRPELGELPSGGGGGRKLFLSFSLSAIIVVSLISWTYFTLLYVENPEPVQDEEPMTVEVIGHQFYWEFVYPNGHSTQDQLVVPEDRRIRLEVTSADVFHNFGVPELRTKADAIPGQQTSTWFLAEDTGTYQANCYELCGQGHSHMTGTVRVVSESEFETWYANTTNESANATPDESANDTASVVDSTVNVPSVAGSTANVPSVAGSGGATTVAAATSTATPASPTAAPARRAPVAPRQHGEVL